MFKILVENNYMHISHNKPCFDTSDIKSLKGVINRRWLISGQEVILLENSFKILTGKKFAVAVNSGLSALHLSLLALKINKGDEVVIPTYTCVALLHAINYIGAKPILVDNTNSSVNLDVATLIEKVNRKTKAIILPHTFGIPADILKVKELGIPIIEDCAQAIGSMYNGKPVGTYGDISVYSFYASKMIAAGQGGLLLTSSNNVYATIDDLVHHDRRHEYKVRYNYQLNDLAASLANSQMKKLKYFCGKRRKIGYQYHDILKKSISVSCFPKPDDLGANYYRFLIRFKSLKQRMLAKKFLEKHGISTIVPIEKYQLLHNQLQISAKNFPNAEKWSQRTLSIPIFPCLTFKEITKIKYTFDKFIKSSTIYK
jgi:perosamine synthetase